MKHLALAVVVFSAALRSVFAAELPARYVGRWLNDQVKVEITPSTYVQLTLATVCRFDLITAEPRANLEVLKVDMTCRVKDDPRSRKLQALFGLREIEGKKVLVIASYSPKWPSIDLLTPE
jgi:hypothetical protein